MTTRAPDALLLAGGHRDVIGGLEIFIARARAVLDNAALHATETPLAGGDWRGYIAALRRFFAAMRGHGTVWLHYGSLFDLAFLLLAKLCGRAVAVTPHLGGGWRSQANPLLRTLSNRLLLLADAVFTLYRAQGEDLRFPAPLRRRCRTMPTMLPQEVLGGTRAARAPGPLRLVHAARLGATKGSFAFVETCAALKARGVAFEAAMIGPASDDVRRRLEDAIAAHGLAGCLRIAAALPPERMADFYRRFDVLVHLSLQDAYPLTVLEAIGCGLGVVCTALPGTVEMAADFASIRLIAGQDADAAARAVESGAPDETARLRTRFEPRTVAAQYRAAFETLGRNAAQTQYRSVASHEKHL